MKSKSIVGLAILFVMLSACTPQKSGSSLASLTPSSAAGLILSSSSSSTVSSSSASSTSSVAYIQPANLQLYAQATQPVTLGTSVTYDNIQLINAGQATVTIPTSQTPTITTLTTTHTGASFFSLGNMSSSCSAPITAGGTTCSIPILVAAYSGSSCLTESATVSFSYTDQYGNPGTFTGSVGARTANCGLPAKLHASAVINNSGTAFPASTSTWSFNTGANTDTPSTNILDYGDMTHLNAKFLLIKVQNTGGYDVTFTTTPTAPTASMYGVNSRAIGWRNITQGTYYNREDGAFPGGVPSNVYFSTFLPLCSTSAPLASGATCYMSMSFYPFAANSDYGSVITLPYTYIDSTGTTTSDQLQFKIKGHGI